MSSWVITRCHRGRPLERPTIASADGRPTTATADIGPCTTRTTNPSDTGLQLPCSGPSESPRHDRVDEAQHAAGFEPARHVGQIAEQARGHVLRRYFAHGTLIVLMRAKPFFVSDAQLLELFVDRWS